MRDDDLTIVSPRPKDELIRDILERGRVLARRRERRRRLLRIGPALLVVLAMLGGVLALHQGGPSRHAVETGPRPQPAPEVRAPVPDLEPPTPTAPAIQVPGATPGSTAPSTTSPTAGGPVTTAAAAPPPVEVAFDQPLPDGRFRTAILRPGARQLLPLSTPTLLPTDPPPAVGRQDPMISPDGATVIFHSPKENTVGLGGVHTVWDLYAVPAAGGPVTQLTDLGLAAGGGAEWPSWSPDGSLVVFNCASPQGASALCTMRSDGSDQSLLVRSDHQLITPAWSPDGRSIALLEDLHTAAGADLWIGPADGSSPPHRVPASPYHRIDHAPMWSADGTQLLVVATDRTPANLGRAGHLVAIDVTSGKAHQVPGLPRVSSLAMCGAGHLVFRTDEPFAGAAAGDIVVADLDGGHPLVLLPHPGPAGLTVSDCHAMG